MAAHNRHVKGDIKDFLGDVRGQTVVEAGDFLFQNNYDGLNEYGTQTTDGYVFPFTHFNTASPTVELQHLAWANFCGVAMESSPSGVTEKITVATSGEFRYPMASTSNVTAGLKVAGTSVLTDQTIKPFAASAGSSCALGVITKTEAGVTYVTFRIMPRISGVTRLDNTAV